MSCRYTIARLIKSHHLSVNWCHFYTQSENEKNVYFVVPNLLSNYFIPAPFHLLGFLQPQLHLVTLRGNCTPTGLQVTRALCYSPHCGGRQRKKRGDNCDNWNKHHYYMYPGRSSPLRTCEVVQTPCTFNGSCQAKLWVRSQDWQQVWW